MPEQKRKADVFIKPVHAHAEAFKIMTYRCKICRFSEKIWNSRDGVTPFCVKCPNCKKDAHHHVDWHEDIYAPDYIPLPGERVFIDFPESLKPVTARRRIQSMKGTKYEVPENEFAEMVQIIISDFHPGTPYLIRIE
jgi:hypothetical protein